MNEHLNLNSNIDGQYDDSKSSRPVSAINERRPVVTVSDAIRYLWKGRVWIAIAAALGFVAAIMFILFIAISRPSVTVYRNAIALTMKGAAPGQYPNGAPFSSSDLRSPVVLEAAFAASNLQSYGYSLNEFSKAIDAQAYSPNIEAITARFRAKATARNVTPEEIKTAEDSYRQELTAAQSEGILVTLTTDGIHDVPSEVGRKVVDSIPIFWSKIFVESLGVSSFPVARSTADLLDIKVVAALDYPLVFDYIDTSAVELDQRLTAINDVPNARNVVVGTPPQTLLDLQRRAANVRTFQIEKMLRPLADSGLSRAAELTVMAYENKSQLLALEATNEERRSSSISNLIRERNMSDTQAGSTPMNGGVSSPVATLNPSISTLGDSSVDKIVALSISSAGTEFREKLLDKKLDIEADISKKIMQRQMIERRLVGLRAPENDTTPGRKEKLTEVFDSTSDATISELNNIWKLCNELLSNLTVDRLNEDKLLFKSAPIAGVELSTPFYRSIFLWAVFFGLIVMSTLTGIVAYLLNGVVKQGVRYRREQMEEELATVS